MTFTRSQADSLLNQAEMALYDDSRMNALRRLRASEIGKRIERARKSRDRARDLLRRQKLASQAKTGSKRGATGDDNQRSKRKAELLTDILKRFEGQLKPARKREKEAGAMSDNAGRSAKSSASRKSAGGKTPVKKAVKKAGKKAASKQAATKIARKTTSKAATKQAAKRVKSAPGPAAPGASAGKSANRSKPITPKRALNNTRKLLEAKQAREREGQPWQTLDPEHDHLPRMGDQSDQSAGAANELHAGESRLAPIQGSISTRDRKHQGKRDHRNDPE